jgi:hypothetical protein
MLKLKKIALVGATLAVAAMMLPGCTINVDSDEEEAYVLTLGSNVTARFEGTDYTSNSRPLMLYKGDVVNISASVASGRRFLGWTATPASSGAFGSVSNPNTTFKMPGFDVTIGAQSEAILDGIAEVRFTWSQSRNDIVEYVEASTDGIKWWVNDVWYDPTIDKDDFSMTDLPRATGNPGVTESIFKKGGSVNNYKKYYPSNPGTYLAVISVDDAKYGVIWEIMAVYDIEIEEGTAAADGEDLYFELGFDIDKWLDGETDTGYKYTDDYDKDRRTLFKAKALNKKQVRKGGSMDVTYYIFPRARK